MKLSVNKEQIIEGLQKAAAIIPAKAGAAYLRSIWLKAEKGSLSIMATDANIEFTGRYPAEVKQPGLIGVQGRAFVDLVRQLPAGVLQLTLDESTGNLLLEQGRRTYKLPVSGAEWFQNFSEFPAESPVTWSGDFLQDVLDRVVFCISDDDATDAITCLYMKPCGNGRIDVCGLNGHQFALISFTHDDLAARLPEEGVLIQKKYLQDMKKWLGVDEIELNITDKRLYLRTLDGAESLSVPRAGHDYPDYTVFMSRLEGDGVSLLTVNPQGSHRGPGPHPDLQYRQRPLRLSRPGRQRSAPLRPGAGHRFGQREPGSDLPRRHQPHRLPHPQPHGRAGPFQFAQRGHDPDRRRGPLRHPRF